MRMKAGPKPWGNGFRGVCETSVSAHLFCILLFFSNTLVENLEWTQDWSGHYLCRKRIKLPQALAKQELNQQPWCYKHYTQTTIPRGWMTPSLLVFEKFNICPNNVSNVFLKQNRKLFGLSYFPLLYAHIPYLTRLKKKASKKPFHPNSCILLLLKIIEDIKVNHSSKGKYLDNSLVQGQQSLFCLSE